MFRYIKHVVVALLVALFLTAGRVVIDIWAEGMIQNDTQETITVYHENYNVTLSFYPGTSVAYSSMDADRIYIWPSLLYIDRNEISLDHCLPYWTANDLISSDYEINQVSAEYLRGVYLEHNLNETLPPPDFVCPVNQ